jgi:hypothetical protein
MTSQRKLPDPAMCKTKHISGVYYYCIVEERREIGCAHAMSFGFSHICMHPDACWYDSEADNDKKDKDK